MQFSIDWTERSAIIVDEINIKQLDRKVVRRKMKDPEKKSRNG
jgi:hypothetical protein